MVQFAPRSASILLAGLLVGCGGAPAPAAPAATPARANEPPPDPPAARGVQAPAVVAVAVSKDSASQSSRRSAAPAYEDPIEAEHGGTIRMTPLVQKGKTSFPARTVGDRECWQGLGLQGDAEKDFDAIIKRCGTPTGLVEYVRPARGKLHHVHDKRDTYKIKLAGGMCYRYFAVADGGIKDLDVLVTKPNGALVADDKTSHPVAIIEFDKAWCADEDVEYDFHVEVDGEGTGHYMFGVWVKPKD